MRHLILPVLLIVPVQFVAPLFVINLFAKDLWFVIIIVSALLILEGITKAVLEIRNCSQK
jgi:hypothetical protein